jgi:hypothetical protein
MPNNLTPVMGYGGRDIIGQWDESQNSFHWSNEDIVYRTLYAYRDSIVATALPIRVRVSKSKMDGAYCTYHSIDNRVDERVILIIHS